MHKKCTDCAAGTSVATRIAKYCKKGNLCYYQRQAGTPTCERCDIGDYSVLLGAKLGTACPPGKTTNFVGPVGIND